MTIKLTSEQKQALELQKGLVHEESFVLMSKEVYWKAMGVESEAELNESLKAIERGLADVEAGRTRPFRDVLAELRSRYAVPR